MPAAHHPRIQHAVRHLQAGGVLAYPTEAVWGLGCCLDDEDAVRHLLSLKQRPVHKGLILVSGNRAHFDFCSPSAVTSSASACSPPGPAPIPGWCPTIGGARLDQRPPQLSSHPRQRSPDYQCPFGRAWRPFGIHLCQPQGLPPARTALRSRGYFGSQVHYCIGAVGKSNNPSQIRDLISGQIVRPG